MCLALSQAWPKRLHGGRSDRGLGSGFCSSMQRTNAASEGSGTAHHVLDGLYERGRRVAVDVIGDVALARALIRAISVPRQTRRCAQW